MTDDDRLHAVDSVRANNLGTCHHAQLIAIGTRGFKEARPKTSCDSRIDRTQDDENAIAALQSPDSHPARGAAVAGDDDIDGPDHCVLLPGAGTLTVTGSLSVRKNASSCCNSTGFSRRGRNSLWPVTAAGARL